MTPLDVIDIGRDALWTLIIVSAPIMLTALFVGLIIALFQALTQIQEMTLTFVPKILAIFLVMMIVLPFMFDTLNDFTERMMEKVIDEDSINDIPIDADNPQANPPAAPAPAAP